ncbi:MAG: M28 family peptidase [Steroidobacteraceae bacterium]
MMHRWWSLPMLLVLSLGALLLALRSTDRAPVRVVPATDTTAFSAQRAYAQLEVLIGENRPHPAGSAANRLVEGRIVARLRQLGYEPGIQAGFKCSTLASGCSAVRNIVAVRAGRQGGEAVMITAHYDSVPGSAAAADDGAGVAAMLEIAALVSQRAPLLHDIVFLFADAEESGLRGAMLFADEHPLMARIGLVVNLEARGVTGPSAMFETSADNAGLIGLLADAVPRPVANSILYEVYRRMPNDTDYSVYKKQGKRGFNFAFTRGASLYHSERDDLAHLDLASLQHQGEGALAVLLRAADAPLAGFDAPGDASYVDLAARTLLHWPSAWNLPLACVAFVLVVALVLLRAPVRPRTGAWAVLAILATFVLAPAIGWLLSWPLGRWPDAHPLDHPYPWPGRIALIAGAVLASLLAAQWAGRRAGVTALTGATWIVQALFAVALAVAVPGTAYLYLWPVGVFVGVALIESLALRGREGFPVAATAGFLVGAYMALYHCSLAETVLGFQLSHFRMLPLLLLCVPLLPLAAGPAARRGAWLAIGSVGLVVVAGAIVGWRVPAHTADRPRAVNLVYVEDNEAAAPHWQIETFGGAGKDVLAAMGFTGAEQVAQRYGVLPYPTFVRPARPLSLPLPEIALDEDRSEGGRRILRGTVRSQRAAFTLGLSFPAGAPVLAMNVDGQPVLDTPSLKARVVQLIGVGEAPVKFEIVAQPGLPLPVVAFDIGALEAVGEAGAILARRPADAAPIQSGNQTLAIHRFGF